MSASPSPPPAQAGVTETQADLYNQVFGEGSDVSDISDDEEEQAVPRRRAFPPRDAEEAPAEEDEAGATQEADQEAAGDKDEDEDDDEDEDEDAYIPGSTEHAAKIPKFKKRREADQGEDEDEAGGGEGSDEERRRRKKKRKMEKAARKERERERRAGAGGDDEDEEAEPVHDEVTQRRLALEERIDNIGKKAKVVRRKKKGDDVDLVETYYDDICARLRERMLAAAAKDRASNDAGMPATAKLAMLEEVMSTLRNTTLWQSIVDSGVLGAVRSWLEPMEGTGALPAVGIQNAIFEVLPKMDLDTETLKEAKLGPIVLFYTKTKRVTPAINRAADALVQAWSRPIIKRPANFRSRHIDNAADVEDAAEERERMAMDVDGEGTQGRGQSQSQSQGQAGAGTRRKRFDVAAALMENKGRKGARMPVIKELQYTVAPESRTQHHADDLQHVSRIQQDNRKFNKFARQLKASRAR
ncbi:Transcription factor IWS1 [Saitozyma sp. JCM 24511]|nr:Transcription factor IWS1 [Saitozyma sp. JCM 24511]